MSYVRGMMLFGIGLAALALTTPQGARGWQTAPRDWSVGSGGGGAPAALGGQPGMGMGGMAAVSDPEMDKLVTAEAKAAGEVTKLLREYGNAKEEEQPKIKTKLSAALTEQFEAQQKRRELELSRAEAQLKKVRALMTKRGEEKKTIVEKRLDQLVREAEGLGWSAPPGAGRYSAFGGGGTGMTVPSQSK